MKQMLAAVLTVSLVPAAASACGCFASTTTVDPVIQAGERILFARTGNQVTAYVQIKFQGDAKDFGWLVPLPAVPDVKAGTDEVFEVLDEGTRPSFSLTTQPVNCGGGGIAIGCGSARALSGAQQPETVGSDPLVLRDTAGPYDYAVLKADSMSELQAWLQTNRFFVPGTSDAALAPYIRPGAFFLALKLRSGQTTGDLRPVVLRYTSDYPMVPLILTSATAIPHMGIQVFVLGAARAVPRNYHHVQLNLFKLDWSTGANYGDLVTAAIAEAPDKHAFITEYAGSPSVAFDKLLGEGRFGTQEDLAARSVPSSFVTYLEQHGYAARNTERLSDSLLDLLETQLPYPKALAVDRRAFFKNLDGYLDPTYQQQHPAEYAGWPGASFDPVTLAAAVWAQFAQPVKDADALLHAHSKLTRLFTVLSPEDMTKDPVFGFNAALPDVTAIHSANQGNACDGPAQFTADGTKAASSELTIEKKAAMPSAKIIELLPEEGPAEQVTRYDVPAAMGAGCRVADGAFVLGLGALWLVVRRRKLA